MSTYAISANGTTSVNIVPMIGLRPLIFCLLALLNTAFWGGILYLVELFVSLPFDTAARGWLLAAIFVLSLIILISTGMGPSNGNPSDPGSGA